MLPERRQLPKAGQTSVPLPHRPFWIRRRTSSSGCLRGRGRMPDARASSGAIWCRGQPAIPVSDDCSCRASSHLERRRRVRENSPGVAPHPLPAFRIRPGVPRRSMRWTFPPALGLPATTIPASDRSANPGRRQPLRGSVCRQPGDIIRRCSVNTCVRPCVELRSKSLRTTARSTVGSQPLRESGRTPRSWRIAARNSSTSWKSGY